MRIKLNIQKFASGTINFANSGSMYGKIEWTSVVQGSTAAEKAALNKSKVTAILYVKRNDGYTTTGNFSGQIGMAGSTSSTFFPYLNVGNSWYEVGRYEKEVSHNDDGTKSITIDGWITGPTGTTWEGKTITGSSSCTLDTIPRYFSQPPKIEFVSSTTSSANFNWDTSEQCSEARYILDSGSEVTFFTGTAIGGTLTITGFQSNTSHTIKIKAKRKDSGLWSDGNTISFSTSNKTVRIRVNGVWKDATPYVRVNNQWKVAVPYTRVNGQWKRGK